MYCCCCVEHSDAEAVRYHDSRSKMNADIALLENCVRDCAEQLSIERAKSEQLELIVSHHFNMLKLFRMFVVILKYLLHILALICAVEDIH